MNTNVKSITETGIGKYFGKSKKGIEDYFNSIASKEGTRFRWRDIQNNAHNNLQNRAPLEERSIHDVKGEVL